MKHLQVNWKSRVIITLTISILVSILIASLELTSWAEQINQQGFSHGDGEKPNIPAILIYILPFFKEIFLIGIPLLLTLGFIKISSLFKAKSSNK